jgi:hypothetical protein
MAVGPTSQRRRTAALNRDGLNRKEVWYAMCSCLTHLHCADLISSTVERV